MYSRVRVHPMEETETEGWIYYSVEEQLWITDVLRLWKKANTILEGFRGSISDRKLNHSYNSQLSRQ